jgi:hypothetical protein
VLLGSQPAGIEQARIGRRIGDDHRVVALFDLNEGDGTHRLDHHQAVGMRDLPLHRHAAGSLEQSAHAARQMGRIGIVIASAS